MTSIEQQVKTNTLNDHCCNLPMENYNGMQVCSVCGKYIIPQPNPSASTIKDITTVWLLRDKRKRAGLLNDKNYEE